MDKELTELQSINEKLAKLSRQLLSVSCNPHREEQLTKSIHLKEMLAPKQTAEPN